jgi:DNA-binding NarL/FixJ family response regulator
MAAVNQARIWIIAPPGRKRESLVALMSSIKESISIQIADSIQQILDMALTSLPTLILVDYQNPDSCKNKDIEMIHHSHPEARIVLLENRLNLRNDGVDAGISELAYAEINVSILEDLINQNKTGLKLSQSCVFGFNPLKGA